jgi:integrase
MSVARPSFPKALISLRYMCSAYGSKVIARASTWVTSSILVLVGAYLGLRWGECAGLQFADLDLRQGFALIHRTISEVSGTLHIVPTKGKPAVIPLPNFLCRELEEHIARFVGADGSVFTSPTGGPLRHNVYKRFYKPALVEAELDPQLRFHDLRHTSASIAGSRQYGGETAKVVQQLLRHSSQQVTTETYMHLFPEDVARLRESLDRVYDESLKGADLTPTEEAEATIVTLSTRREERPAGESLGGALGER